MVDGTVQPSKSLTAYCDGGCSHNPGGAVAAAFVLRDSDGRQLAARGFFVTENGTSNMGELVAVAKAAQVARELGATSLRVFSDSQLAVNVISGAWRAKAEHIQDLRDEARDALNRLPRWTIAWRPREENEQADTLAGCALRARADVDFTGREIFQSKDTLRRPPAHKRRFKVNRKPKTRGSIYSECFVTSTMRAEREAKLRSAGR